jgi:hypothetical protein
MPSFIVNKLEMALHLPSKGAEWSHRVEDVAKFATASLV